MSTKKSKTAGSGVRMMPDRLRKCIKERGISQQFIADKIGVKRSTVNQWVNGKKGQTADHIAAVADVLCVSAEYLTGESEYKTEWDRIGAIFDREYDNKIGLAERFIQGWFAVNGYKEKYNLLFGSSPELFGTSVKLPSGEETKLGEGWLIWDNEKEKPSGNWREKAVIYASDRSDKEPITLDNVDIKCLRLEVLDFIELRMKQLTDRHKIEHGSEDRLFLEAIEKL